MSPLLEAKGLEISFGGVVAAQNVNVTIHEGQNLAIIGPNGAGKTTFLNICTGYLKPSAGSVWFEGRDITRRQPRQITRMGVARAFQIPQLFVDHTALENILIALAARERRWHPFRPLVHSPEREEAMHVLGLVNCAEIAHRPVSELPEGQRKLVDIAVALALRPKLIFMDEPTSGVASSEKFAVLDIVSSALAAAKVTAVFVEHDIGIVERFADEVAVWNRGEVLHRGPPDEVLSHPDVIRDVIGEDI